MRYFNILIWFILLFVFYDQFKTGIHYYMHQIHDSNNAFLSNLSYLHMYRHRLITPDYTIIPSYLKDVLLYDILIKNIFLQTPLFLILFSNTLEYDGSTAVIILLFIEWVLLVYDYYKLNKTTNKKLKEETKNIKNIKYEDELFLQIFQTNKTRLKHYSDSNVGLSDFIEWKRLMDFSDYFWKKLNYHLKKN